MMFIAKFNALIRNRFVWSFFAAIVIASFVLWQTRTDAGSSNGRGGAGKLDGKEVPEEELRSAYFGSYLHMSFAMGKPLKTTPRIESALRDMAWRRLATLRAASEKKISADSDEVVAAIRQQSAFQKNGRFSPEHYSMFINEFLAQMRVSEQQFQEYVRQEIVLSKMRLMLEQAAWVSPSEIEQTFHQLHDEFAISYVLLSEEEVVLDAEVSDEDCRQYFAAHSNEFVVPQKMRCKYAAFPFDRGLDEFAPTEKDARDFYDEHIEMFTVRNDGESERALDFSEVEREITNRMTRDSAKAAARDRAAEFEVALAPERSGAAISFEEAASRFGSPVSTSTFFSITDRLSDPPVDSSFNRAAFSLRFTPDEYFSYPVQGSNAYYVLAFHEKTDARASTYMEARNEVRRRLEAEAFSNTLMQVAIAARNEINAALIRGEPFSEAASRLGLEALSTGPFTLRDRFDNDESPALYSLLREILLLNPGELTDIVNADGALAIGRLDYRKPADRVLLESMRKELGKYVRVQRAELVFGEWQEYLLALHGFEDLSEQREGFEAEPEEDFGDFSEDDQNPGD